MLSLRATVEMNLRFDALHRDIRSNAARSLHAAAEQTADEISRSFPSSGIHRHWPVARRPGSRSLRNMVAVVDTQSLTAVVRHKRLPQRNTVRTRRGTQRRRRSKHPIEQVTFGGKTVVVERDDQTGRERRYVIRNPARDWTKPGRAIAQRILNRQMR